MKRAIACWLKTCLLGFYIMTIPDNSALAAVAGTTLERISHSADVIAVASVERIDIIGGTEDGVRGKKVAIAKVIRSLKGATEGQQLAFLAQPTWTCDVSHAVVGETVLLFLNKADTSYLGKHIYKYQEFETDLKQRLPEVIFYQIAHHGGGRINTLQFEDSNYLVMGADREWGKPNARLYTGYIHTWPEVLPVMAHPDAKETHLRLIPLGKVEAAIVNILQTGEK